MTPDPWQTPNPGAVLRVGCAAGFSGDRSDAAGPIVRALIDAAGPACLIFETLAERTLALAQLAKRSDPDAGYEPLLDDMLRPVLADCLQHHIRIVSNFGAANPQGAARHLLSIARELGCRTPRIAVVTGDDLLAHDAAAAGGALLGQARPKPMAALQQALLAAYPDDPLLRGWADGDAACAPVSANAYLGADAIAQALRAGADIVVAGRVADPSLTVGPAMAYFGWAADAWDVLARATMAGHLLECGAQVTGGYFADPGIKDVPDLATVGFPIAEIDAHGQCTITKPAGTGGCVYLRTVKEQLLYEVHDPSAYLTPDVVADLSQAVVTQQGPDRVALRGVRGHPRPGSFKVLACVPTGWLAEAEISYAGPRALQRAQLAADVLRQRLAGQGALRIDWIGALSVFADDAGCALAELQAPDILQARDIRLRAAWRHADRNRAERLNREVTALYTCGPAGGGGVRTSLRPTLGSRSCLMDRAMLTAGLQWFGVQPAAGATPVWPQHLVSANGEQQAACGQQLGAEQPARGPLPSMDGGAPQALWRFAHARTGDKGNTSNISLIAHDPADFDWLVEQVTPARVADGFADRRVTAVRRYLLPQLAAMNFVLDNALDGGVNDALNLDGHGKTLSFRLLEMLVVKPDLDRVVGPAEPGTDDALAAAMRSADAR